MKRFCLSAFVVVGGTLVFGATFLRAAAPSTTPATQAGLAPARDPKRLFEMGETFNQAHRSTADLDAFIKDHPQDKDWCGKALIQIGRILEGEGKLQEAIDSYLKAAKDYGREFVPGINSNETVGDYANVDAALCYHKLGKTEEALPLLDAVSKSQASWNIPRSARQHYLTIKQEKYELAGRITSELTKLAVNQQQAVRVEIRNTSEAALTFQLSVQLTNQPQAGAGSDFTDGADGETTLKPGETLTKELFFSARTLKGVSSGEYYLVLRTDGVKVTAAAVKVKVE